MSILEDFYCGEILPAEEPASEHEEYQETYQEAVRLRAELEKSLNEKEREMLDSMLAQYHRLHFLIEMSRFLSGWRMGARFLMDTFQ